MDWWPVKKFVVCLVSFVGRTLFKLVSSTLQGDWKCTNCGTSVAFVCVAFCLSPLEDLFSPFVCPSKATTYYFVALFVLMHDELTVLSSRHRTFRTGTLASVAASGDWKTPDSSFRLPWLTPLPDPADKAKYTA